MTSIATEVAQEKKWQAENDARTLVEAAIIKKTPSRLKSAKKEAKILATKAKKEASVMATIAKPTRSVTKKATRRKK